MADVAALSATVLLRVAEFLKTLPADQLDDLAGGVAKLELVPKGGRRPAAAKAAPSTVDGEEARQLLASFTSVAAATRYLDGMKLTVAALRSLAAGLGVSLPAKAVKNDIRDAIVRAYVGDVLNSEAIRRQAAAR